MTLNIHPPKHEPSRMFIRALGARLSGVRAYITLLLTGYGYSTHNKRSFEHETQQQRAYSNPPTGGGAT